MNPFDLIIWSICILVAFTILSESGMRDWIVVNILKKEPQKPLDEKVKELEERIEFLEKSKKNESEES